ncbi:MAG: MarR family transcriptional regulator [Sphingomonadales bacterium]|nr:MarR family transcriptional regulator [Sphingomonadales bacterium]
MSPTLPCACTALRKASRAITRLYDERLADSGMTITQFAVLRHIAREGGLPLSRLADLLVMERTSLYRTMAPLERQGWVAVEAAGSRVKIASLTEAGFRAMENTTSAWEHAQSEIISAIGVTDFQLLEAQLQKLVAISSGKTS